MDLGDGGSQRDRHFEEVSAAYRASLDRLARVYEAQPEECRDLLQDIYLALWSSLKKFDGRCSLRTWVYRVAHNVGASHVRRRTKERLVSLEEIEVVSPEAETDRHQSVDLDRLYALIRRLHPLDRQMLLLYLEGFDAVSIGEVMGVSPGNVATKVHRIKNVLTRRFKEGPFHAK